MDWRRQSIIAFDTETTGLNPLDGDRIIEFAAVEMHLDAAGGVDRVVPHQLLFNPGIPIPRKVVEITGIDDDTVADAPPFARDAKRIWQLLQGSICVAHNVPFDRTFLSVEFKRAGLEWPDPLAEVDTIDLSMQYFSDAKSHKLGDLAQRLEVDLTRAHRATDDAEATGRCFIEMARRFDAPSELGGMLDWADAIGRPPETGYIRRGDRGVFEFAEGPHEGQAVEYHPLHLQWMTMARTRREGAWVWRFPENLRRWALRFLKVRASGRARQNPKSFGPNDWTIDSNALPLVAAK